MEEKIAELEKQIAKVIAQNKKLEKRIATLEKKLDQTKDYRYKDDVRKVLGFSISDVNGYLNAVKTVSGQQLRVYIGKDSSEENIRRKIIENFVNDFRFYKAEIKQCEELCEIPEIATLIKKNSR